MNFHLYKTQKCFSLSDKEKEDECLWGIFKVEYSMLDQKKGIVSVVFYHLPNPSVEKISFNCTLSGELHHEEGFGEVFSLGWEIEDKYKNKSILIVNGGDWTNSFGRKSIAIAIKKFLNEFYQFDSIEDYLKYNKLKDEGLWKNGNIIHKIKLLSEIIKLYEKYTLINPASYCVRQLLEIIRAKIN